MACPSNPLASLLEEHVWFRSTLHERLNFFLSGGALLRDYQPIIAEFIARFKAHDALEEQCLSALYVPVLGSAAGKEILHKVAQQDGRAREMLAACEAVDPEADLERYRQLLLRLREELEAHMRYEESEAFPALLGRLTPEACTRLARNIDTVRRCGGGVTTAVQPVQALAPARAPLHAPPQQQPPLLLAPQRIEPAIAGLPLPQCNPAANEQLHPRPQKLVWPSKEQAAALQCGQPAECSMEVCESVVLMVRQEETVDSAAPRE